MTAGRTGVLCAGGTHEGRVRDQNEDRWWADAARGVFCVVDGVGGHPGGERASAIAIEMLRTRLARETGSPAERLREAITLANNAILDEARQQPALAGMTCVLTAALLAGRALAVGHVGDTRIYKLRGGRLQKLTRDHSPVGEREDAGELTEAEAMRHPRRNEVYRDVGARPHAPDDDEFVEIVETTFEEDAALLLCSDGLTDQVPAGLLQQALEAHAGRPAATVEALIQAANDAGGKDNVTVLVVEGEDFAAAVRARRGGVGGRDGAESRDARGAAAAAGRGRGRALALLLAGMLAGALLALGAVAGWPHRPAWLWPQGAVVTPVPEPSGPRTWRVGLGPDADAASIADALDRARAGDTITVAPGDYREPVVIRQGITLYGPTEAVIRPPLGAAPGWTAVSVRGARGVRLHGLTIAGASGETLARGLAVEQGEVQVHGLRVSGATEAGVELAGGGEARLFGLILTDNPGAGVVAGRGSRLSLQHSVVLRNGTVAGRLRPGVVIAEGAEAELAGNAIGDNGGPAVVGWAAASLPALIRDNLLRPVPRAPQRRPPGGHTRPAVGAAPR